MHLEKMFYNFNETFKQEIEWLNSEIQNIINKYYYYNINC